MRWRLCLRRAELGFGVCAFIALVSLVRSDVLETEILAGDPRVSQLPPRPFDEHRVSLRMVRGEYSTSRVFRVGMNDDYAVSRRVCR